LREAARPGRADALADEGFGPSGGDLGGASKDFGQQASRCEARPAQAGPRARMALQVKAVFDSIDSLG
jgi:hypothetical protein